MGDTRRQSGTKRKPPNRSKSRATSCLANTNEPWYNTAMIKLPNNIPLQIRNGPRLKTPIYTTNNPDTAKLTAKAHASPKQNAQDSCSTTSRYPERLCSPSIPNRNQESSAPFVGCQEQT